MIARLEKLQPQFTSALSDSYELVKLALSLNKTEFVEEYHSNIPNIHIFQQSHSNTGGGWERANEMVGHAFVGFWVIVIEYPQLNVACVYINGRAAYVCEMNEDYQGFVNGRNMPLWNEVTETKIKLLWYQR